MRQPFRKLPPVPKTPVTTLLDDADLRIRALSAELEALGLATKGPVDKRAMARKARYMPQTAIRLVAARARISGGVIAGMKFDPIELETHLDASNAAGPLVRLLRGLADRIEFQALEKRADIARRIKAAQAVLIAHARLGDAPAESRLLRELRAARPRRKQPRG